MNILVNSFLNNHQNETNSIIKSNEVICPKCLEEIKLKIKNYKISLYECKNGHNIDDIYFKDFLNTQNIDLKKIICNNCNIRNIKSIFILRDLFNLLDGKNKLEIINYNKEFQNKLAVKVNYYKRMCYKYCEGGRNWKGKEYKKGKNSI